MPIVRVKCGFFKRPRPCPIGQDDRRQAPMLLLCAAANGSAEFQFRDTDTKRLTPGTKRNNSPVVPGKDFRAGLSGTKGRPSDKRMIGMRLFAVHSSVCCGT